METRLHHPVLVPKVTPHPRLRTLVRKMKGGRVHTYYVYDMRGTGEKDVQLGKDWNAALARWRELHEGKDRVAGTIEEAFGLWEEHMLPTYASAETKRGYTKNLRKLRLKFAGAAWADVKLQHLVAYLHARKAKTQGNRELSLLQIIWNFARVNPHKILTELPWPAAGLERSRWKNPEQAREIEVTDAMFNAVYAQGDQLLKDAMDLASASAMRITDVRTIPLPPTDTLKLKASKTGKKTDFDVSLSAVLPDLIKRRRANKQAEHLMLLAGPFRRPVSYRQLNDRYTAARAKAVAAAKAAGDSELADAVARMVLRDCRKYAADLATSPEAARELLQHGDVATTLKHYRTRASVGTLVR